MAKTTPKPAELRVRNKGLVKVRVGDLVEQDWNPAIHPDSQAELLDAAVEEIGWVGYPDVFELPDGRYGIGDGHLRKKQLVARYGSDTIIECNLTDFDEETAKKFALTKDPITKQRIDDEAKIRELMDEIDMHNPALQAMLDELAGEPIEDTDTVLKRLETKAPPKMSWTLIGIPTVRFGEIAEDIERLALIDGIALETTVTD